MNICHRSSGNSQPQKTNIFIDFKNEKYYSAHEIDFMTTNWLKDLPDSKYSLLIEFCH
jgi:hypothetical protein